MDNKEFLELKNKYEDGILSENDLTDEQVVMLTNYYTKEIDELKNKSNDLDNKLSTNKQKFLELIEKAKNLKK